MKNNKNKIPVVTFLLTLSLITGCNITTTRNQYYGFPDQSKNLKQDKAGSKYAADTLKNRNNGQNR